MDDRSYKYIGIALAVLFAGVSVMGVAESCSRHESFASKEVRSQPGTPLDAVRVNAPSFADGDVCYKVMNRGTGKVWFMVQMRDGSGNLEWEVLSE